MLRLSKLQVGTSGAAPAPVLIVEDIAQAQRFDNVELTQNYVLQVDEFSQSQLFDNVDLTQNYALDVQSFSQTQSFDNVLLSLEGAILTNPTFTNLTSSSATIGCTTNTAGGILYWYVSTSATAPDATNGDMQNGVGAVDFGNLVPTLGANTAGVTGLSANTDYYHYWIQETT